MNTPGTSHYTQFLFHNKCIFSSLNAPKREIIVDEVKLMKTFLQYKLVGVEYSEVARTVAVSRFKIHEGFRILDSKTQSKGFFVTHCRRSTF